MSSQDSEGGSYVADYIANPEVYGEVDHYGWTTDEEEDTAMKETKDDSSKEEDDPLPQPGDMHVEFKKSSLPRGYKPEVQFIPSSFLQESKVTLCKKILNLELENDDLREENFMLKYKLKKKATTSPPPTSSPLPKET